MSEEEAFEGWVDDEAHDGAAGDEGYDDDEAGDVGDVDDGDDGVDGEAAEEADNGDAAAAGAEADQTYDDDHDGFGEGLGEHAGADEDDGIEAEAEAYLALPPQRSSVSAFGARSSSPAATAAGDHTLQTARQKALQAFRFGGATSDESAPSTVPAAAPLVSAFATPSAFGVTASAAAESSTAPKGKSSRDKRKEAREAKLAGIQSGSAAARAHGLSGGDMSDSTAAREQAKRDRAARFASTNAAAAAAPALSAPSRSPTFSASLPEFGAPPAFIGGRGGGARSTASMMASAMGGAGEDDDGDDGNINRLAENYAPIVGECLRMCPEDEALARQESRDLSYFEIIPGTGSKEHGDVPHVDLDKAVKKYKRAAAAQTLHAKDVRPPHVLEQTMRYLLTIMDRHDSPDPPPLPSFLVIFRFVSDRLRALRTDFNCQNLKTALAVQCFEQAARFHILTMYELGDLHNIEKWDPTPNMEKLSQTLTSLRHMYLDNYTHPSGVPFPTPNEAECHSYRLLIELGSGRFGRLYEEMDRYDPRVKQAPVVQFCVAVYNSIKEDNYVRFFALARRAPYLLAVLLNLQFNKVRARALEIICSSYLTFPFASFQSQLAFESEEHARSFLSYYQVPVDEPSAQILCRGTLSGKGESVFCAPPHGSTPFLHRNSTALVGSKRPPTISQAVLTAVGRGEGIDLGIDISKETASAAAYAAPARSRAISVPKSSFPAMPAGGFSGSDADMVARAMDAAAALPASSFSNGRSAPAAAASSSSASTLRSGVTFAPPVRSSRSGSAFGAGVGTAAADAPLNLSVTNSKSTRLDRGSTNGSAFVGPSSALEATSSAFLSSSSSAFPPSTSAPSLNPRAASFQPLSSTSSFAHPAASSGTVSTLSSTFGSNSGKSAFETGSSNFGATNTFGARTSSTFGSGSFAGGATSAFGNSSVVPVVPSSSSLPTSSVFGVGTTGFSNSNTGSTGFSSVFSSGASGSGSVFGVSTTAALTNATSSSLRSTAAEFKPSSAFNASALSTQPSAAESKPIITKTLDSSSANSTMLLPPSSQFSPPPAVPSPAMNLRSLTSKPNVLLPASSALINKPAESGASSVGISPSAISADGKLHLAGFQLPAPSNLRGATSTSPPPTFAAPSVPSSSKGDNNSAASTFPDSQKAGDAVISHPRPPVRQSATVTAASPATNYASAAPAGQVSATITRASSTAVSMDREDTPTRGPTTARRPMSPSPTAQHKMFLASLRCYRHILLRRTLRAWAEEGRLIFAARRERQEALRVLEARADRFAATKFFLKWHESMIAHQAAQQRFIHAQTTLHTPATALLLPSSSSKQHRPVSKQLLLKSSDSPGGQQSAPYATGGVLSGLGSPLAKLHRMGIALELQPSSINAEEAVGLNFDEAADEQDGEEEQGEMAPDQQGDYDQAEGGQDEEYVGDEDAADDETGEYANVNGTEGEGDEEAYIEGDEDGDEYYDEEAQNEEQAENAAEELQESEEAAEGDGIAAMDTSSNSAVPLSTPQLRQTTSTRSPHVVPTQSTTRSSFVSPLRSTASMMYSGALGSSHKRSRQSLEVDRFLTELASSPLQRRYGLSPAPNVASSVSAKKAQQQPAAQFSLDGAPLLDDESEADEGDEQLHRASSRVKLFHTPSAHTPRVVFSSPAVASAALTVNGFSAFDVGAALDAAAGSSATYLRPRLSFGVRSPAVGSTVATEQTPSTLASKVQAELRASNKLNELMQQIEYRFGNAS